MSDVNRYGFTVRRAEPEYWKGETESPDRWTVQLPHQCDAWTVTADDAYADAPEHTEAVVRMERFVNEAVGALAWLRSRRETGTPR